MGVQSSAIDSFEDKIFKMSAELEKKDACITGLEKKLYQLQTDYDELKSKTKGFEKRFNKLSKIVSVPPVPKHLKTPFE